MKSLNNSLILLFCLIFLSGGCDSSNVGIKMLGEYRKSELSSVFILHIYEGGGFELYEVDFTSGDQYFLSGRWENKGSMLYLIYQSEKDLSESSSVYLYKILNDNEMLVPMDLLESNLSIDRVYDLSYKKELGESEK